MIVDHVIIESGRKDDCMFKTAVFVPSYCLTRDKSRLTTMNKESMVRAAPIALRENATLIISTAYDTWKKETDLRITILKSLGVPCKNIAVIEGATNSYSEIEKTREIIHKEGFGRIIVVAEKWHAPRVLKTFQFFFPELKIELKTFVASRFEFTHEPSAIKSLRIGWETTWRLWNNVFEILTPLILKHRKR